MRELSIDIETYSGADLKKCGVYKYVESSDFEIILFAYAFDNDIPQVVDLTNGGYLPFEVECALEDETVIKTAHNANFERTCIAKHFNIECPPEQWECTMILCAVLGLPLGLDQASTVLRLAQGKDAKGKGLINYFSKPCKPTKVNGERTRNLPEHAPDKWKEYQEYCRQDVVVEMAIKTKLAFHKISEKEKLLWNLDQEINDRGVLLDLELVHSVLRIDRIQREYLTKEAMELTGLSNPNSANQLKEWLSAETDTEVTQLRKEDVPELLKLSTGDTMKRVLEIRQELSKTSIKKYTTMCMAVCADGRLRGLFQYRAAGTGRWGGRLVQPQNLPGITLKDIELARVIAKTGNIDEVSLLFGNVSDTLSQLIRTAFIAEDGSRLTPSDFSSIEARIIAWLAGEQWRIDVFNTHGKIYEASASMMFHVPIEQITKDSPLRKRGKIGELALGFGGGKVALENMDTKKEIKQGEHQSIVDAWRAANPKIVALWKTCGNAAIRAVDTGEIVKIQYGIRFFVKNNILFIQLPSGRCLAYMRPKLTEGKFGGKQLEFEGVDSTTKKWGKQRTYGGSIVENIVQAIACDLLGEAMLRAKDKGYQIVLHVHDEIVPEVPNDFGSIKEVEAIMSQPIDWAPGLPLAADGFESPYYKK